MRTYKINCIVTKKNKLGCKGKRTNRIKNKRNIKNKSNIFFSKKKYGGIGDSQKEIEYYRLGFIEFFLNILYFENNRNVEKLDINVNNLIDYLNKNKKNINILIPVNEKGLPIMKQSVEEYGIQIIPVNTKSQMVSNFVSPIVVILNNIKNNTIIIKLLNTIKSLGANFNLKSSKNNITPLNNEINKERGGFIDFLVKNGSNQLLLTKVEKEKKTNLLKKIRRELSDKLDGVLPEQNKMETQIEHVSIVEKSVLDVNKLKLPFSITKPYDLTGYESSSFDNPIKFWFSIFTPNELQKLKETIVSINSNDNINKILSQFDYRPVKGTQEYKDYYSMDSRERTNIYLQKWKETSMCKIVKNIMKNYDTTKSKTYTSGVFQVQDGPQDTVIFNLILCSIFLIMGIISNKLEGQDYYIVFKGGKAIQLALKDSIYEKDYSSDDIDIIILSKGEFIKDNVENLSLHVANLIIWLFVPQNFPSVISIQEKPDNELVKLSYNKISGGFKAISDISYGQLSSDTKKYFRMKNLETFGMLVPELQEYILFKFPNGYAMLEEKIYLFAKYIKQKELSIDETCDGECLYLLSKFRRALLPLLDLEILKLNPNIFGNEEQIKLEEKQFISDKLQKMGESPEFIHTFNNYLYM